MPENMLIYQKAGFVNHLVKCKNLLKLPHQAWLSCTPANS